MRYIDYLAKSQNQLLKYKHLVSSKVKVPDSEPSIEDETQQNSEVIIKKPARWSELHSIEPRLKDPKFIKEVHDLLTGI